MPPLIAQILQVEKRIATSLLATCPTPINDPVSLERL